MGNELDNLIIGSDNNNVVEGGLVVDTLTGGLGADRFVFTSVADSAAGFSDTAQQLRFDAATHTLQGSTNAGAAPEFAVVLTGVNSLAASSLLL